MRGRTEESLAVKLLPVIVMALLSALNAATVACLKLRGFNPEGISWPVWRFSLPVSAVLIFYAWAQSSDRKNALYTDQHWIMPALLVLGWLLTPLVYIGQALWFWELPELASGYLFTGPLAGFGMALLWAAFNR
ncbi:hypothetical protein [Pantoea sp. App145]|uniref:hypothetical protein n=2 Tax=unclassified Pantoea TaxID=2630326 RepID=UPI003A80F973